MRRKSAASLALWLVTLVLSLPASADIDFFWRAEGTTLDGTHDFTVGDDTAAAGGGSEAINTDAVYIGTNGVDSPGNTSYYEFTPSGNDLINGDLNSVGAWVRYNTSLVQTSMAWRAGVSGNSFFQLEMGATGFAGCHRNVQGGSNVSVFIDTTLSADTWYFIVCRIDTSAPALTIEVYNTSLSLVDSESDTVNSHDNYTLVGDLTYFRVGASTGSSADQHIDNVFISDTYDTDDLVANAEITSWTGWGGGGASGLLLRRRR